MEAFDEYHPPPDIIRVDFERLATVPGLFTDEAERVAAALSAIEAQLPLLRTGWEGPAADIFFADMERDAHPALRRLVHALRHGSDVSAVMLRVLDDAERAAARIDWSGGGVVAASSADDGAVAAPVRDDGRRGGGGGKRMFDGPSSAPPNPAESIDASTGLVTRANAEGGVLTLDNTGGGGGGGSILLLLALLFYYKMVDQTVLTMLAQQHAANQVLLAEAGGAGAAGSEGMPAAQEGPSAEVIVGANGELAIRLANGRIISGGNQDEPLTEEEAAALLNIWTGTQQQRSADTLGGAVHIEGIVTDAAGNTYRVRLEHNANPPHLNLERGVRDVDRYGRETFVLDKNNPVNIHIYYQ